MCGVALKGGGDPTPLKPGAQVRIISGPLSELVADVQVIAPDRRLVVLMEVMGGQTRVAVKADQLGIVGA
jgi:transcriptional antiterminator RfaH